MTFRERLDHLRKEKQWTIQELADAAGIDFGTVKGYLVNRKTPGKGKKIGPRLPSLRNAIALAKALGQPTTIWDDCSDMREEKPKNPKNSGDAT